MALVTNTQRALTETCAERDRPRVLRGHGMRRRGAAAHVASATYSRHARGALFDMDGTPRRLREALGRLAAGAVRAPRRRADAGGAGDDGRRLGRGHHADRLHRPGSRARSRGDGGVDRWLHDYTGELFDGGLPWCPARGSCWTRLPPSDSDGAGHQHPSRADRARAEEHWRALLLGVGVRRRGAAAASRRRTPTCGRPRCSASSRRQCLAIEDSVTGTAAAESAGCPVLVVPNDVEVPAGRRRAHVSSLAGVDVADLRRIHADLSRGTRRTLGVTPPAARLPMVRRGYST